jgi:hypothetical protein
MEILELGAIIIGVVILGVVIMKVSNYDNEKPEDIDFK